jgi:hypothetical protein
VSVLELTEAGPLKLPLAEIKIDPELQCRANGVSKATLREYADVMREHGPDRFVPVVVFKDSRGVYWLADGFHRCAALASISENGAGEIAVDIREGSRKDALLFAAGANASHGLKRSQADRRASVERLLSEPAWAKRADNWLASKAVVSPHLVKKIRDTLKLQSDEPRETADGRVMDTSNIGNREPAGPLPRLVGSFRKLLGQVPADSRVAFSDAVLACLSASAE